MLHHLRPGGAAKARLRWSSAIANYPVINNILKVGAVSCVGPIQTNLTIMIITAAVARFGQEALAGYGIGARLEMLLVNIAFGVGIASVPMVAGALGAGMVSRAYEVAWSAGALGAALLGAIGVTIAFAPSLWSALFTDSSAVIAASNEYLSNAGWGYGFFGMGLCLFFASQGLGHVMGTVFAGTLRLLTTILGAWWLAARGGTSAQVFTLVALAMAVYGIAAAAAIGRLHWRDRSMRRV
jgi:Na+-driven multidrug efflux pump